ncbi:MAG TPA: HAD-IIA family hydrolase [Gemmatimonadales bacterium]|jgi:HAD superfamily hydrolase (TIGR01458 family)|nr:HAD-IIA family hydrolase [Gemmatimonadales bacterium]
MPAAYLFDLDGTLYQNSAAIPGAVDLIRRLKSQGTPFRFLTNTTSKARSAIVTRLGSYGFPVESHEVFTALLAGAELARSLGCRRLLPLVPEQALEDLEGFELVGEPDAVLVGDLAEAWSFDLLQQGFAALLKGARLIALSRDRYWMTERGLTLDSGPFVALLEDAAGVKALVAGKPSAAFFEGAVESMSLPAGIPRSEIVMIGDDLRGDIAGAQAAGYAGYLVRTGKYQEDQLQGSGINPERILASVAELL